MKLQFLNTIALDVVSGGNIYNKTIIEGLRQKNIDVDYNTTHVDKTYDVGIVDSLCMNTIDREKLMRQNNHLFALIHQVPSLTKDALAFYKTNAKFIITGEPAKLNLINNWQITKENISIIRSGVSESWKPKMQFNDKPQRIIMVSNFVKNKGYEMLINILKRAKHLDIEFHVIGNNQLDKPYAESIIYGIEKTNADVTFHFNLSRNEVYKQLIASDVFLSLSESETFGMALFEALSLNIPCIAYKTGDYNYFNSFKNYSVQNDYSEDSFIETIEMWTNNPNIYKSFCNSTIQNKRNWNQVIKEFSMFLTNNTKA